ncbi:MAG: hypothetical protein ACYSO1_03025 [Planctomycetota bacterium]|jgi:hypothetical protein
MTNTMRYFWLTGACLLCVIAGCTTVPITGRSQFNTIPDSVLNSMAIDETDRDGQTGGQADRGRC